LLALLQRIQLGLEVVDLPLGFLVLAASRREHEHQEAK
jgi:hypothetical protein